MTPMKVDSALNANTADVGYCGTLNSADNRLEVSGELQIQGVWSWKDRAKTITYRELKAIRVLMVGPMGQKIIYEKHKNILLHGDKKAVVQITNGLVFASRPMMRELPGLNMCWTDWEFRSDRSGSPELQIVSPMPSCDYSHEET